MKVWDNIELRLAERQISSPTQDHSSKTGRGGSFIWGIVINSEIQENYKNEGFFLNKKQDEIIGTDLSKTEINDLFKKERKISHKNA